MFDSKTCPLVSIVIPIYNGSNYMREAIDSALIQTYKNIEVIVVNDGSTDDTEEIAKSYGDRIRYFSKKNGGVATALNMAIKKAKGEYISWLSHDDIYYPDKIEQQIDHLIKINDNRAIVFTNYDYVDKQGEKLSTIDLEEHHGIINLNNNFFAIFAGCLHGCTLLAPKEIFYKIGFFDPGLHFTQDYDLWFKFACGKVRFTFLNIISLQSRDHNGQTSKKAPNFITECNTLWIKLMSKTSSNDAVKAFGSKLTFYEAVHRLTEAGGYRGAADYATKLIEGERKKLLSRADINPKVSVIIPCYNRGSFLAAAINSVLAQSYKNIEIIVINDGSTDDTAKIAGSFGDKIKLYTITNSGVSAARNLGIVKASGKYIQFLDADDILLSGKILNQVNNFCEYPEIDIQFCDYYVEQRDGTIEWPSSESLGLKIHCAYEDLLLRWQRPIFIPVHTFLFRRECFEMVQFPQKIKIAEDWIMWLELAKQKRVFHHNNFLGAVYRIHGENATRNKYNSFLNKMKAIEFVRSNLVDPLIVEKFDLLTADYIRELANYLLPHKKNEPSSVSDKMMKRGFIRARVRKVYRRLAHLLFPAYRVMSANQNHLNLLLEKTYNLNNKFTEKFAKDLVSDKYLMDRLLSLEKIISEFDRSKAAFSGEDVNLFGEKIKPEAYEAGGNSKLYECNITDFFNEMKHQIIRSGVVLDIGCGIRPQTFFTPAVHICVEPFRPYREIIKPLFSNDCQYIFLKDDALKSIKSFDDGSVDTVFMLDLIEHLDKKAGLQLLKEADRIARRQIIIFTPLGFFPMHFDKGEKDIWGLTGGDFQEHKSGWTQKDFGKSYNFYICKDCHESFLPEEKKVGKKYSGLMAIKTKKFNNLEVHKKTPDFVWNTYRRRVLNRDTENYIIDE